MNNCLIVGFMKLHKILRKEPKLSLKILCFVKSRNTMKSNLTQIHN